MSYLQSIISLFPSISQLLIQHMPLTVLMLMLGILGSVIPFICFILIIIISNNANKVSYYLLWFVVGLLLANNNWINEQIEPIELPNKNVATTLLKARIHHIIPKDHNHYTLILNNLTIPKIQVEAYHKLQVRINQPLSKTLKVGQIIQLKKIVLFTPKKLFYSSDNYHLYGFSSSNPKIISEKQISYLNKIYNYFDHLFDDLELPDQVNQIGRVLLLGKSAKLDANLYQVFQYANLIHIFVISGLHLTMIAFICLKLISYILCLSESFALNYSVQKFASCLTILILTLYLSLVGYSAATQRAYIMVVLSLLAIICDKTVISNHTIGIAAILILILNPSQLFSAGFQMTFLSVLTILNLNAYIFSPKITGRDSIICQPTPIIVHIIYNKIIPYILSLSFVSFFVSMSINIVNLYHFHIVNLYSFLSNLIVVPLVLFIIIPGLMLTLLLGLFNLQFLSFYFLTPVISYTIKFAEYIGSMPYVYLKVNDINTFFLEITIIFLFLALAIQDKLWKIWLAIITVIFLTSAILLHPLPPDLYIASPHIILNDQNHGFIMVKGKYDKFLMSKIRTDIKYQPCLKSKCIYQVSDYTIAAIDNNEVYKCSTELDFIIYNNVISDCHKIKTRIYFPKNKINLIYLDKISQ